MPTRVFISGDELKQNFDDYQIIDMRRPKSLFDQQRAVDSIHLFLDDEEGHCKCWDTQSKTGARHALPPIDKFLDWCESRGVGRKSKIVLIDRKVCGSSASRGWFQLSQTVGRAGVQVHLRDGGWHGYLAAGLPTEEGADTIKTQLGEPFAPGTAPYTKPSLESGWHGVISMEELVEHGGLDSYKIFDARSAGRFAPGPRPVDSDAMAGHIPGAFNFPWFDTVTGDPGAPDTRLKPADELKALYAKRFAEAGVTDPAKEALFSCGSSVTACFHIAVLTHLGLPVPQMYIGSFSEFVCCNPLAVAAQNIEKQGFAIYIPKKTLSDAPAAFGDAEKQKPVTVEGAAFSSIADAVNGRDDDKLAEALSFVHCGEAGKIFTEKGTYEFSAVA